MSLLTLFAMFRMDPTRPRLALRRAAISALGATSALVLALLFLPTGLLAQKAAAVAAQVTAEDSLARSILAELLAINTAPSGGEMSRATKAMSARLLKAGYPAADVVLAGPDAKHQNLVAKLRGRDASAKPVILMAHIDVVEALASDWSMKPYELHEKDGYFYGRGSTDNKGGAAVLVANMMRWKREKFVPSRDVILVLTTDEETSAVDGIQWLLKRRPELAKAEYALNTDAGGLLERDGKTALYVQSSEKMYQTFEFAVTNRGGHSSLPRDDNAIYTLAAALTRLEKFHFPVMLNDVTRTSFMRDADMETGAIAAAMRAVGSGDTSAKVTVVLARDPSHNGNLRTTCVATMLAGGHAENALPQKATATVNCRIFPGVSSKDVLATLQRVVSDTAVHISMISVATPSAASPLRRDVLGTVERVAAQLWPRTTTIPVMENGATDGLFLRNLGVPVYGVSGPLYVQTDDRAHGRDERVGVRHFYQVRELWYRMVKELLGGAPVS